MIPHLLHHVHAVAVGVALLVMWAAPFLMLGVLLWGILTRGVRR